MDIKPKFRYFWDCKEEDEERMEEDKKPIIKSEWITVRYNPSYKDWKRNERRKRKKGLNYGDPRYKYSMQYDREEDRGKLRKPRSLRGTELPPNVVQTLFQKQIGLANSTYSTKLDAHVINQMITNRAPQDSSHIEIHTVSQIQPSKKQKSSNGKNMKNNNKWIRTTMKTNGGCTQKIDFCDSYFMVKEPGINTRKFYSLNPFLGANGRNQFQLEYEIPDQDKFRYKWRHHSVWYMSPYQQVTTTDGKILQVPNTLFVLENQKLVLYNLHNGIKLQECSLSFPNAPAHYSRVATEDCNDMREGCQVHVYGYKLEVNKANPEMMFEILVFDYPPLRAMFRILVLKNSRFGTFDDFKISEGQLLAVKGNVVESYDLKEVISKNFSSPSKNSETPTVILRNRCTPLFRVQTYRGVSDQIDSIWPPCVAVRTKSSLILKPLDDLEGQIHKVESNKDGVAIKRIEGLLEPFVAVCGLPHGIDILQVDRKGREVQLLFSTRNLKFEEEEYGTAKRNQDSAINKKETLRPQKTINYRDMEYSNTIYRYDYNLFLNLLAICKVSNGYLNVVLLKCKAPRDYEDMDTVPPPTLPIFKRLQPVKLTKPKGIKNLHCVSLSAVFDPLYLLIKLRLCDCASEAYFEELYIARLLGEFVPSIC